MATSVEVPTDVMSTLLAGFVAGEAVRTLQSLDTHGARPTLVHLRDSFGRVFAWAWEQDHTMAMILLADYLAELRVHGPGAPEVEPPIRLDEVLNGLRIAVPEGFTDYDEVVNAARNEVPPGLYGDESI
jgi:hypothetical protein